MINEKQIVKIMKKVGKKVDEKIKKEEEELARIDAEKKKKYGASMIHIKNMILALENEHKDRGVCVCLWNYSAYIIMNGYVKKIDCSPETITAEMNLIISCLDRISQTEKKFYMFSKEKNEELSKIHKM